MCFFPPGCWSVMDSSCLSLCVADDEGAALTQSPHSSLRATLRVQLVCVFNPTAFILGEITQICPDPSIDQSILGHSPKEKIYHLIAVKHVREKEGDSVSPEH